MKTALTVWEKRISPVFDSASMLLVAEIENSEVVSVRYEPFDPDDAWRMVERLAELNIKVLICGAISQLPANIIETANIELIPFVTGRADEVLAAYAKDVPVSHIFHMPGCRKRTRQGRRGQKINDGFTKNKEVIFMPRGNGTGPQGQGPRTGRGQGGCQPGQAAKGSGGNTGQGQGRGLGQGQGQGQGQGRGQGRGKSGGQGRGGRR